MLGVAASEEKESDPKKKSEPEFTEGVIVKVTTDQPISRKDLKVHSVFDAACSV